MTSTSLRTDPASLRRSALRIGEAVSRLVDDPRAAHLVALHLTDPDRFGAGFVATTFEDLGDNPSEAFTAGDVAAVALMGHRLRAAAARAVVGPDGPLTEALAEIPSDVDLWQVDEPVLGALDDLWAKLVALPSVDWGTATTLVARKRPRLVIPFDLPIHQQLRIELRDPVWRVLWMVLRSETSLVDRVEALRPDLPIADRLSTLRVLYIAAWMRRSGTKAAREARFDVGLAPA